MKVGVIFVGGTPRQNIYWWPSYRMCDANYPHDIILVHRNMDGVPIDLPSNIRLENKILESGEIQHRAFGAYRYYFQRNFTKYDIFAFVSDDVYLRRDGWIKNAVEMFEKFPKLGIISPMLHNNPPHTRAPIWFGRTECLIKMNWGFADDHDAEMTNADRCINAGYFVAQIGHKIDFAYDPEWFGDANPRVCGAPQPNQWIEKIWFGEDHFNKKFTKAEILSLDKYLDCLKNGKTEEDITDIRIRERLDTQHWNICFEIQPYHGLLYNRGLDIVKNEGHPFYLYEKEVKAGHLDISNCTYFGPNNGRYICSGVNKNNPIAILKT